MTPGGGTASAGAVADPRRVQALPDLARELDRLRTAAGRRDGRRPGLDRLVSLTGVPRSTLHACLSGARTPQPDVLDLLVTALGASARERDDWADALDRVRTASRRARPDPDTARAEGTGVVPRQLPARGAVFQGRSAELAWLDDLVGGAVDRHSTVAVVHGTGGVGKSTLLLHWAHENMAAFPDGQIWIDLRGFSSLPPLSAADVLERMLRAVGVGTAELPADVDARAELLRTALADRRMLIVLDNARDVPQVRPLIAGAADVLTVVTSRNALRPLVLSGAVRLNVGSLSDSDALALVCASLPVDVAESVASSRIVEQCAGLPLALRIVRERLSYVSAGEVERYATLLSTDARSRLTALDLNDADEGVSVFGALLWSYQALPADAALALRRLPMLRVQRFRTATFAVLLDVDEQAGHRLLDQLAAASVLDQTGLDEWTVHDLVASFAERCAQTEQDAGAPAARARLMEHVLVRLVVAGRTWGYDGEATLVARDLPALASPSTAPFASVDEARVWCAVHADLIEALLLDGLDDPTAEVQALAECAYRTLFPARNVSHLAHPIRRLLDHALAVGDDQASAVFCHLLAVTHGRDGDVLEAQVRLRQAIELAERAGDRLIRGKDLGNLGFLQAMTGDVVSARRTLTAAAHEMESHGSPFVVNGALVDVCLAMGDLDGAAQWSIRAQARPVPNDDLSVDNEFRLLDAHDIRVLVARGDVRAARQRVDAAIADARAATAVEALAMTLTISAELRLDGPDAEIEADLAESEARSAAAAAVSIGERWWELKAVAVLGETVLRQGRPAEALEIVDGALVRARRFQLRLRECELLLVAARCHSAIGSPAAARSAARDGLAIAQECGFRPLGETFRALLSPA